MKKESYITPTIEIITLKTEGIIATSGGVGDMEGKPWPNSTRSHSNTPTSNTPTALSELEDLINDILTVQK